MTQERSIHDLLESGLNPTTVNPQLNAADGTVTGQEVDLRHSDAHAFHLHIGNWLTDGIYEFQFYEGDVSGALTAVAARNLRVVGGTLVDGVAGTANRIVVDDATQDDRVILVGYIGGKRFARCDVVTTANTSGTLELAVAMIVARNRAIGMTPMSTDWPGGSIQVDGKSASP